MFVNREDNDAGAFEQFPCSPETRGDVVDPLGMTRWIVQAYDLFCLLDLALECTNLSRREAVVVIVGEHITARVVGRVEVDHVNALVPTAPIFGQQASHHREVVAVDNTMIAFLWVEAIGFAALKLNRNNLL